MMSILEGEGERPDTHIGTNDIGRKIDEDLRSKYRELGKRLKSRTSMIVISGAMC